MYPSNLYHEYSINNVSKTKENIIIQVGNSADCTNDHIEVFNKLKRYKNIKIICPLSYGGDDVYIDNVIKEEIGFFEITLNHY